MGLPHPVSVSVDTQVRVLQEADEDTLLARKRFFFIFMPICLTQVRALKEVNKAAAGTHSKEDVDAAVAKLKEMKDKLPKVRVPTSIYMYIRVYIWRYIHRYTYICISLRTRAVTKRLMLLWQT